jgi:RNA polymerase sigma-70 factor (ECF subfamily)
VNIADFRPELERLHQLSYAWARHCCRHRADDAEELLQDVYIRVLDGRAHFDGRSSFKTWLFGVIRRSALAQSRSRWLRSMLLERWQLQEPEDEPALNPEHLQDLSARNEKLRRTIAQLPRRQQEVLHLVFYQDLTVDESAQLLGISLGSARTHFGRGKQRLRDLLQEGVTP